MTIDLLHNARDIIDAMSAPDARAIVVAFCSLLAAVHVTNGIRRWRSR